MKRALPGTIREKIFVALLVESHPLCKCGYLGSFSLPCRMSLMLVAFVHMGFFRVLNNQR